MNMFYSGQKVVCINADPDAFKNEWISPPTLGRNFELVEGKIYTLQWIGLWGYPGVYHPHLCVTLFEFPKRFNLDGTITPFDARRFKPLLEKKTSIDAFQEILNDPDRPIADTPEKKLEEV